MILVTWSPEENDDSNETFRENGVVYPANRTVDIKRYHEVPNLVGPCTKSKKKYYDALLIVCKSRCIILTIMTTIMLLSCQTR